MNAPEFCLFQIFASRQGFYRSQLFGRENVHIGNLLESHPDSTTTPGIEISGGSLGQIPGVTVGRALGIRKHGPDEGDRKVYVLIGDGECNEGAVWEAFMAAGHYGLDNVVFVIDYNKVQLSDTMENIVSTQPVADKWRALNWEVTECDGHSMEETVSALSEAKKVRQSPVVIIAHTVKGKGVSFMEHRYEWHGRAPDDEEAERARQEILST